MKHWLMLQGFTALNTMYRKSPGKQTTHISPKGNEKQIDYIITKRRHLKYNKDAEANDMIHMGSHHRCVMATFKITTPKRDGHRKIKKKSWIQQNTIEGIKLKKKTMGMRSLSSEKGYQEIIEKIKEKAEAANEESKQIKEKSSKQKKQQHKQKVRKQKRKQRKQTEGPLKSR